MTRQAILVLGMHRSGTSAVTGMLIRLGASGPRTLLPAAPDNPLGFWESAPFCDFNDRLLRTGDTDWDLWSRVTLDRVAPQARAELAHEFGTLLEQEFGDSPLFVVKDPRICRLTPFWTENLRARGIGIGVVLVVRHPLEAAQSLVTRDGITVEHALLQWLRHVLESENETRQLPRAIVGYDEVLADWRGVAKRIGAALGVEWPPTSPETAREIDAFVQPGMRHHTAKRHLLDIESPLGRWMTEAWAALEILRTQSEEEKAPALAMLDAVRRDFDTLPPIFERIVDNERRRVAVAIQAVCDRDRAELQERLAATTWAHSQLAERSAALEAAGEALRGEVAHLAQEASWFRGQTLNLTTERDALRDRLGQLDAERARMAADAEAQAFEIAQLRERSAWTSASLSRRAQEAENHVRALHHSLSWRVTAPFRRLAGWLHVITHRIG